MEKSNNFPFNVDREELSEKKGKSKIRKSKITDEVIVKEENISIKDEDEINHNGAWSDQEHEKYIFFVECFKKNLSSRENRKRLKIFKVMEQLIESRSSIQCRSHHVKLMRTNKTIPSLINKYKRSVGFKKYADRFKKLQTQQPILNKDSPEYLQAIGQFQGLQSKEVGTQTDLTMFKDNSQLQVPTFQQIPVFYPYQFYIFSPSLNQNN